MIHTTYTDEDVSLPGTVLNDGPISAGSLPLLPIQAAVTMTE